MQLTNRVLNLNSHYSLLMHNTIILVNHRTQLDRAIPKPEEQRIFIPAKFSLRPPPQKRGKGKGKWPEGIGDDLQVQGFLFQQSAIYVSSSSMLESSSNRRSTPKGQGSRWLIQWLAREMRIKIDDSFENST